MCAYIIIYTHTFVWCSYSCKLKFVLFLFSSRYFSFWPCFTHLYLGKIQGNGEGETKIYLSQIGHPENYRQGILLCRSLRAEEENRSEASTIPLHTEEFFNSLPGFFKTFLNIKKKKLFMISTRQNPALKARDIGLPLPYLLDGGSYETH